MKKYIIFGLLLAISTSLFAKNDGNSYFIRKDKEVILELDTRNPNKDISFSFDDYDIAAPTVCQQANVFCEEKTYIKTYVEKEWEVTHVPQIWDKTLTAQQFSKYYPNLSEEDGVIHNWSDPKKKWIVQRILYERGLLGVFPTGKIGFMTEDAIARLQYYKGIEEIDYKKGIIIIGPKTIHELNKLKERMKNPDFVSRTPLPEIPFDHMTPFHQKRLGTIYEELRTREYIKNENTLVPQMGIMKPKDSGNLIQIQGEIKMNTQK